MSKTYVQMIKQGHRAEMEKLKFELELMKLSLEQLADALGQMDSGYAKEIGGLVKQVARTRTEIAGWFTMIKEFCESLGGTPITLVGDSSPEVARIMLEQAVYEREQLKNRALEAAWERLCSNCKEAYLNDGYCPGHCEAVVRISSVMRA